LKAKYSDIEFAFDQVNAGSEFGETQAYLDRRTGEIHVHSDLLGDDEEGNQLPQDIDDAERYLAIPDKRDLDLGSQLVFDFVRQVLPDDYQEVRAIFSRRGAYGRFKAFLAGRRVLDQWYDFENKAEEAALRAWCEQEGLELSD
jgi:hypothetical protein